MKLISWNVNGIRAVAKKGFSDWLKSARPDLLGLQEIKISDEARLKETFDFEKYEEYWHPAKRPGYSGTAILAKTPVKSLTVLGRKSSIWKAEFKWPICPNFILLTSIFPMLIMS